MECLASRIGQGQSAIGPQMSLIIIEPLRMHLCGSIKDVPIVAVTKTSMMFNFKSHTDLQRQEGALKGRGACCLVRKL